MDGRSNLETLSDTELAAMEDLLRVERVRREREAREAANKNMLAMSYHRQTTAPMVGEVRVWQQPSIPMMGYPSGFSVWHEGECWKNDQQGVNLTEPGAVDGTWTRCADDGIRPVWEEVPVEEVPGTPA